MKQIQTLEDKQVLILLMKRAVRFGLTGVFITGLHFVAAIILIEYLATSPPIANGLAFAFATAISYLINTLWSFSKALHGDSLRRFLMVSALGFLLAIGVSWVVQQLGFGYFVGICAVALTIPPVSFLLHNFWTYR